MAAKLEVHFSTIGAEEITQAVDAGRLVLLFRNVDSQNVSIIWPTEWDAAMRQQLAELASSAEPPDLARLFMPASYNAI
jgi:hypothetical protein